MRKQMIRLKERFASVTLTLFAIALVLSGCAGTVVPNEIKSTMPSFDSSTPMQYDANNSGFVTFITNDRGETDGALITKNAKDRYNALISDYRLQFREVYKSEISQDSGVTPYRDGFGNWLYKLDVEHLSAFMRLATWAKDGRDKDSIWLKLKSSVIP